MRPLIVVETIKLDTITLLSAELYDEQGSLLQPIILPLDRVEDVADILKDFALEHDIYPFDVWTSTVAVYVNSVSSQGISAYIKHPSDTESVRNTIERERALFIELYEPLPEPPEEVAPVLPQLPAWRAFIAKHLRKLLQLIEGDSYEIH